MMARNIEEKMVFGVSYEGQGDGIPLVVLGCTNGAWDYMRDGKTHNFDLTSLGIPIKVMVFGAPDHTTAMKTLEAGAKTGGSSLIDARNKDFSIKPKP